jgi:hypothetical protein
LNEKTTDKSIHCSCQIYTKIQGLIVTRLSVLANAFLAATKKNKGRESPAASEKSCDFRDFSQTTDYQGCINGGYFDDISLCVRSHFIAGHSRIISIEARVFGDMKCVLRRK